MKALLHLAESERIGNSVTSRTREGTAGCPFLCGSQVNKHFRLQCTHTLFSLGSSAKRIVQRTVLVQLAEGKQNIATQSSCSGNIRPRVAPCMLYLTRVISLNSWRCQSVTWERVLPAVSPARIAVRCFPGNGLCS
jgi:hypothetical protein